MYFRQILDFEMKGFSHHLNEAFVGMEKSKTLPGALSFLEAQQ
jgi:hypothetical protein